MEEERYYEEEISLKELIMALVNNWKLIAAITLIFILVAGSYVGFKIVTTNEIFESTIEGVIKIPNSTTTRFGTYSFPTTDKWYYLNIAKSDSVLSTTIEDLIANENSSVEEDVALKSFAETITINTQELPTEEDQAVPVNIDYNRFDITLEAHSQEEAVLRLSTLVENYLEELRLYFKSNALVTMIESNSLSLETLPQSKEYTEMELTQLEEEFADLSPVITLKKLFSSDPDLATSIAIGRGISIEDLSDEVMYEEVINPDYTEMQATIIELKKRLQGYERSLERNQQHLTELLAEKEVFDQYYTTGDIEDANLEVLDVIGQNIQFGSSPRYTETPVESNYMLILAISLVLGGMVGVFAAFIKEYMESDA